MRSLPNLAGRPFVNERPAKRLIGALWALAVVLLLTNGYRYWRYATTNVEGREQLQAIRTETNGELARIDDLRTTLASFDLDDQNEEIEFLNRRIAERSFPWSELFEQLGEVLPRGVRVRSLAPQLPEPQRRRRGPFGEETRVTLRIDGAAENGEALLSFVDSLFAHAAFEQPLLERESREGGTNLINFNLETYYRPRLAADQVAEATAPSDPGTPSASESGEEAPSAEPQPSVAALPETSDGSAATPTIDAGTPESPADAGAESSSRARRSAELESVGDRRSTPTESRRRSDAPGPSLTESRRRSEAPVPSLTESNRRSDTPDSSTADRGARRPQRSLSNASGAPSLNGGGGGR